jgi:hypothetical protein
MKITARTAPAAHKTPSDKLTAAQTKGLQGSINYRLKNSDVGIDQSETAGTDITNQTAPRGTSPKAAALYEKFKAAYDPRDFQSAGASLYAFTLKDGQQAWGVQKWDDKSTLMVLFDRTGEIGRGKLNDNGVYDWSVRKS